MSCVVSYTPVCLLETLVPGYTAACYVFGPCVGASSRSPSDPLIPLLRSLEYSARWDRPHHSKWTGMTTGGHCDSDRLAKERTAVMPQPATRNFRKQPSTGDSHVRRHTIAPPSTMPKPKLARETAIPAQLTKRPRRPARSKDLQRNPRSFENHFSNSHKAGSERTLWRRNAHPKAQPQTNMSPERGG